MRIPSLPPVLPSPALLRWLLKIACLHAPHLSAGAYLLSFITNELDESRDAQLEEGPASSIATGSTTYASWPQHCADIRRLSQGTVVHGSDTVSVMEKIVVLQHLEREDCAIPDYLDRYRSMAGSV